MPRTALYGPRSLDPPFSDRRTAPRSELMRSSGRKTASYAGFWNDEGPRCPGAAPQERIDRSSMGARENVSKCSQWWWSVRTGQPLTFNVTTMRRRRAFSGAIPRRGPYSPSDVRQSCALSRSQHAKPASSETNRGIRTGRRRQRSEVTRRPSPRAGTAGLSLPKDAPIPHAVFHPETHCSLTGKGNSGIIVSMVSRRWRGCREMVPEAAISGP